jgi:hypothetical protein
MNNYCYDLTLPYVLLKEDYDPFSAPFGHTKLDIKYITDEFFQHIDSLGLRLLYVEVFVKGPNYGPGIHVDAGKFDMAKLNWVYGGKDSTMCWYKPKIGITHLPTFNVTPIKSQSLIYKVDSVELVHEQSIGFPSLIQSGVPHGVYTKDDNRYCYSAVMLTKDDKRLSFKEMLELFTR